MSKHRLTAERIMLDDVRFIDRYGYLHIGGRQVTYGSVYRDVEVGDLWGDPWAE
jgi:hypothetical protein